MGGFVDAERIAGTLARGAEDESAKVRPAPGLLDQLPDQVRCGGQWNGLGRFEAVEPRMAETRSLKDLGKKARLAASRLSRDEHGCGSVIVAGTFFNLTYLVELLSATDERRVDVTDLRHVGSSPERSSKEGGAETRLVLR